MLYKTLNKEQLLAAKAPFGNNLVIASAETGRLKKYFNKDKVDKKKRQGHFTRSATDG